MATITLVGCASKAFVKGWHRSTIKNGRILTEAINQSKREGRGLVTVMNHVSVLDDPLVWGSMPFWTFWTKGYMRWTLGAQDICFNNKAASLMFSLGQVLSTKRFGVGPFQPSLDAAIALLSRSNDNGYFLKSHDPNPPNSHPPDWVHIYPEGFVHQPFAPHENTMKYFKWGVSRLILEPARPPIVVPIFGHGLQKIFPEDLPKRALGRGFKRPLLYEAGPPLDEDRIAQFRQRWKDLAAPFPQTGYVPEELQSGEESCRLRSEVAAFVRQNVATVRDLYGLTVENPRFSEADFWKSQTDVRIKGKN